MIDEKVNELPKFEFQDGVINITGRAIPENAGIAWNEFLGGLFRLLQTAKQLTINFKLDYYNSSSSIYLTDMFNMLNTCKSCKSVVNWYYFAADETAFENGEIYQESYTKVKVNLNERND
jgi:hypothetical protein